MTKPEKYKQITNQLLTTYVAKNSDYGDSFGKSISDYGTIAGLVRISDKFHRAENLIQGHEPQVKDEALKDTLLDLASYSIMLIMELD